MKCSFPGSDENMLAVAINDVSVTRPAKQTVLVSRGSVVCSRVLSPFITGASCNFQEMVKYTLKVIFCVRHAKKKSIYRVKKGTVPSVSKDEPTEVKYLKSFSHELLAV
jgi:hypothetical protein